jgi:hypothetical protein
VLLINDYDQKVGLILAPDAYTHELFPEDILFKTLILDNEKKLAKAHIKAAQRQGII